MTVTRPGLLCWYHCHCLMCTLYITYYTSHTIRLTHHTTHPHTSHSVAELICAQELEDLNTLRASFLDQLVATRILQTHCDDAREKLDRTHLIRDDSFSSDFIMLDFLASRLFVLRNIVSQFSDPVHSIDGSSYLSWCHKKRSLCAEKVARGLDMAKHISDAACVNSEEKYATISLFIERALLRSGSGKGVAIITITTAGR